MMVRWGHHTCNQITSSESNCGIYISAYRFRGRKRFSPCNSVSLSVSRYVNHRLPRMKLNGRKRWRRSHSIPQQRKRKTIKKWQCKTHRIEVRQLWVELYKWLFILHQRRFHVSVSLSHRHLTDINPIALKALNSIAGQSTFELLVVNCMKQWLVLLKIYTYWIWQSKMEGGDGTMRLGTSNLKADRHCDLAPDVSVSSPVTQQKAAAAKQFIENHYKNYLQGLQDRKDRYIICCNYHC